MCRHHVTACDLPFYDIFAPTKNSFFELFDDVIACDLWFGPPLIKNPGYAYALETKDRNARGQVPRSPRANVLKKKRSSHKTSQILRETSREEKKVMTLANF